MCDICGVKPEQLATVYESYEKVGCVLPEIADELGIPQTCIIAAGAGDNAAAAVGTGTVGDGKCNISLGTSGTILSRRISSELIRIMHYIHLTTQTVIIILWDVCFQQHHAISGGWMKSSEPRIMQQSRKR